MADETLNAQGLNCPLPIIRARKALATMMPGQTLEVTATDPGSVPDFAAFCRMTGNELLESNEDGPVYRFVLRKPA